MLNFGQWTELIELIIGSEGKGIWNLILGIENMLDLEPIRN